jgi:transposase
MAPTPCRVPGVKGHRPAGRPAGRPAVGTRDDEDLPHASGRRQLRRRAAARDHAGVRRPPAARRARAGARAGAYPAAAAARHGRVVLLTGDAPADCPHLEPYRRLPAYSPRLNATERLWKVPRRRRSAHNRLFDARWPTRGGPRGTGCGTSRRSAAGS